VEVTLLDLDWWCARSGMIADSQWQPADSSGLFSPFSSEGDVDANNHGSSKILALPFCLYLLISI
jgi:hypothetical protein